eukprot:jgi/Picsp_1/5595/NSC_02954-R1_protein
MMAVATLSTCFCGTRDPPTSIQDSIVACRIVKVFRSKIIKIASDRHRSRINASLRVSQEHDLKLACPAVARGVQGRESGKVNSDNADVFTMRGKVESMGVLACSWLYRAGWGFAMSLALVAGQVVVNDVVMPPAPAHAVTTEQLLYLEAWRAVDRAYVDKTFNGQSWFRVRENTLKKKNLLTREDTHAEIKSMLASLDDPFTRFLDPDQYKALKGSTSGDVTGVGLEVSFTSSRKPSSENPLVVVAPSPGGPAEKAGIKAADEVIKIDGKPTSSMSLYEAGNALQGPVGSSVELTVQRPGMSNSRKDVKLVREKIDIKEVDAASCPVLDSKEKIGYIRISKFSKRTADGVRDAILALRDKGVSRFVLDIRNNGGGVFAAGVQVGRMWINQGNIVLIADSEGVRDVYEAEGGALDSETPLTVLVNKGTASASEVLAGALKDNKRAGIVGENTFGKGLIQTLVELSDGSAVTITVSKYQTPNGIDINKKGIDPDIRLSEEELEAIPLGSKSFCKYIDSNTLSVLI